MSLCTSLKGHLKSKFLVLSDDRILPPYQPNRGKRTHPDNDQDTVPGKRTHQDPRAGHPDSVIPGRVSTPVPGTFPGSAGFVPSMTIASSFIAGSNVIPPAFVPPRIVMPSFTAGGSGGSGSQPSVVYPSSILPGVAPHPPPTFANVLLSAPPPSTAQVGAVSGSIAPLQVVAQHAANQAPSFKTVTSRRSRAKGSANSVGTKHPAAAKTTTGQAAPSGRLTPSRAAKNKKEKADVPIVTTEVTSPSHYESCDETGDEAGDQMEEAKDQDQP